MGRNNNNNDENRSLNISAVNFGDATHTILIYYYTAKRRISIAYCTRDSIAGERWWTERLGQDEGKASFRLYAAYNNATGILAAIGGGTQSWK